MKKITLVFCCLAMLVGLLFMGAPAQYLGAADGKMIAENRCTKCHGIGRIELAGHDLSGWSSTVDRMMAKDNFGPKLSDAERRLLLEYLTSL